MNKIKCIENYPLTYGKLRGSSPQRPARMALARVIGFAAPAAIDREALAQTQSQTEYQTEFKTEYQTDQLGLGQATRSNLRGELRMMPPPSSAGGPRQKPRHIAEGVYLFAAFAAAAVLCWSTF